MVQGQSNVLPCTGEAARAYQNKEYMEAKELIDRCIQPLQAEGVPVAASGLSLVEGWTHKGAGCRMDGIEIPPTARTTI